MNAAVIIPSFNGAQRLPHVFRALENQTNKNFVVIVVIDGSEDDSEEVVEDWSSKLNIRAIVQPNMGRSGARNAGARARSESLFIFLDDDMRPVPQWLQMHLDHHRQYPNTALTGRQQSDPLMAQNDFQQFLAYQSLGWMKNLATDKKRLSAADLFFTSANCSIPSDIFEQHKGFDESLSDTEDFELATRMLESGVEIYFDYNCLAWHDDLVSLKRYIERKREYRASWMQISKTKPHLVTNYNRFNPQIPQGIKGWIFSKLAHHRMIHFTDRNAFMLLPQPIRYRYYAYVIAALGSYFTETNLD